jgi:two-component system, NtrC family, sensor kinase
MDEETRKQIFDPFFSTLEVGKGSGLDLSIAFFIISQPHNGIINVESSPGEGSICN